MPGPLRMICKFLVLVSVLGLAISPLTGCALQPGSDQAVKETQVKETELELHVQQTLNAQQQIDQDVAGTLQARAVQLTPPAIPTSLATPPGQAPTFDQTQAAAAQLATLAAITQAAQQNPSATRAPTGTPSVPDVEAFDAQLKSSKILLYEDMVSMPDTNRYVKDTLKGIGLPFVDTGNAVGLFKEQLQSGGPGGQGWDLVILAAEAKSGVSGDSFDYVNQALDKGSSVVMEVWYLDRFYNGSASSLLQRCGIQYQGNWVKVPTAKRVLFPLAPADPVLSQPNTSLSFTKVTDYWWDSSGKKSYDIGDIMRLAPSGDARLLVGTVAGDGLSHAMLTVCLGGRLTLQTFSSHIYDYTYMQQLWENYIYNALKVKLAGGG